MPTYEYVCKACGHRFEVVRSIHADALTECPDCGGELRKVFAPPAISFKGSGFYATDHRQKAKESAEHRGGSQKEGQKEGEKERKKEGQKADVQKKDVSGDRSGSKISSGPRKDPPKRTKTEEGGSGR